MDLNLVGIAAALATFLGIWMGHVLVRVIEFRSSSLVAPMTGFGLLGVSLLTASFLTASRPLSAALGILSMTAFWDVYEFFRQEKRVIKGHAPANPDNPRHRNILAQSPSATTLDLLKREPLGRQVSLEESVKLIAGQEEAS